MARLPYVERENADLVMRAGFELAERRFGFLLNVVKMLGNTPDLASPLLSFIGRILRDGRVDWVTKELAILKTTRIQECEYCVVQHVQLSQRLGIPVEKISALWGDYYKESPLFDDRERAVIELAAQITVDANGVTDGLIQRLRKHFSVEQIVELVLTIAAYTMVSKFGDALGIELEPMFGPETMESFEAAMKVPERRPAVR